MKCKKLLATIVVVALLASTLVVLNQVSIKANYYADIPGKDTFEGNTTGGSLYEGGILTMTEAQMANIRIGNSVSMTFNASLLVGGGIYLYYPEYKAIEDTGSGKNELWLNWTRYEPSGILTSANNQFTIDFATYNYAGMWIVAATGPKTWMMNASSRSVIYPETNSTEEPIKGWFWVNSSTEYTVTTSKDTDTVEYGKDSETLSIYVKDTNSAAVAQDLFIDIWNVKDIGDDGTGLHQLAYHKWLPASYGGIWTINDDDTDGDYTNLSNVIEHWGAGTYQISAYRDVNPGTSSTNMAKLIYGQNGDYTNDHAFGYNSSFGQTDAKNWSARFINSGTTTNIRSWNDQPVNNTWWQDTNGKATTYCYEACGPFNPPEYLTAYKNLTVDAGKLTISIINGTVNWNSSASNISNQINVSITNYTGLPFPASLFTVTMFNTSNNPTTATSKAINSDYYNVTRSGKYLVIRPNATNTSGFEPGNYHNGNRWGWNRTNGLKTQIWAPKGKVYVVLTYNQYGNSTVDWNTTFEFTLGTAANTFEWVNDGSTGTDKVTDGELGAIPVITKVPVNIQFSIYNGDYEYFGKVGSSGSCRSDDQTKCEGEAAQNITISGDSMFTGTLYNYPNFNTSFFNNVDTWTVPIVPLMNSEGGLITITVNAWNTTITGRLSIGGSLYYSNGTVITVTPNKVYCDKENYTLDITVKHPTTGADIPGATVTLYYIDEEGFGQYAGIKSSSPIDTVTSGAAPTYSMDFNRTRQTTNQSGIGLTKNYAKDRNLTVYVNYGSGIYGYALLKMEPNSNLEVVLGRTTMIAGYPYRDFSYTCSFVGNDTGTPTTTDKSNFNIKIYDQDHNDVTATLFDSAGFGSTLFSGEYSRAASAFTDIYATTAGTYTFYAFNRTCDSAGAGYNGTLVVEKVEVSCDKSPFIWKYDDNISATFSVIYKGQAMNGTLRIDNISSMGAWNSTWKNTSFDGTSDVGGNSSIEVSSSELINGQITINDITANILETGQAVENITFWFKPESDIGVDGGYARASGKAEVSVPTVRFDAAEGSTSAKSIKYIRVGATTNVVAYATGRGTLLPNIYVGLSGQGVAKNGTTGTVGSDLGKITFSIIPTSTGNITVDIGADGRTSGLPLIIVTSWELDIAVTPRVNELDSFTVTITKLDDGAKVQGASVEIKGIGTITTDADGEAVFEGAYKAPEVTSDTTYTITATADGYASDTTTFVVVNIPKLTVTVRYEKAGAAGACPAKTFTATVSKDDANPAVNAKVTFEGTDYYTDGNGQATITAPETAGTYTITATFGTFLAGTATVTVLGKDTDPCKTPGFELLTLIIAIGVAFILLRRRRR